MSCQQDSTLIFSFLYNYYLKISVLCICKVKSHLGSLLRYLSCLLNDFRNGCYILINIILLSVLKNLVYKNTAHFFLFQKDRKE